MSASANEMFEGRSGTQDERWKRTYRRVFRVETTSTADDAPAVMAAPGISLGAVHPNDSGCFASRISADVRSEDGLQWIVSIDYSVYDPNTNPQNPLDMPLQITWGAATFDRIADEDNAGDAIVNSAGDYFDPPLAVDDSRPVLRVVRNEATYDPVLADTYANAINTDTFFGRDPYTWKCSPIMAELKFNKDSGTTDGYYYTVTYEFQYNPDEWREKILDQGLRVLASSVLVPATEKGLPVTKPILLDGAGAALTGGGTPVFLTFNVRKEVAFAGLSIDPTGEPGQP